MRAEIIRKKMQKTVLKQGVQISHRAAVRPILHRGTFDVFPALPTGTPVLFIL